MANQEHLNILDQGVEAWNKWRKERHILPDLNEATLSKADLTDVNFSEANLIGANLSEATLTGADLSITQLNEADLRKSILHDTNLTTANLTGANLTEASLFWANLRGADLKGANLSGATLAFTIFVDTDLSVVTGLEMANHSGPSSIGTDTIYRSQGHIPEDFMRKAGVPDSFIEYMRSLVFKPIDYYTCFISYSSKDSLFARRLYADLQSHGVRCWFAPEDMKIGDKIRHRIDESIRLYDKLLLVLSEHSITSTWVEQEVETALAKEREGQPHILFPIRLDDMVMQMTGDWPALIRNTRHIGDFTRWKQHDDYQQAFKRLLRDLKAEA